MKITQTIKLEDEEILAIKKVLSLCYEISDIAHCSVADVFDYLCANADIIGDYEYSIVDILQIAEMVKLKFNDGLSAKE